MNENDALIALIAAVLLYRLAKLGYADRAARRRAAAAAKEAQK